MDANGYLKRLDIMERKQATLDFLQLLQHRHVTRIPFENFDIVREIPLSLKTEDLYDKIVIRERGGVCYELNGFFHTLLRELGYTVSLAAATVKTEEGWFLEGTHAINIVQIDGTDYLADVGFGGRTPRQPIPFTGEEIHDVYGSYRVRPHDQAGKLALEKCEGSEWETLYKFNPIPKKIHDFHDVFMMTQYGAESKFNKVPVAMILNEQGRVTLRDHSLTLVDGDLKTKETVQPEDLNEVLAKIFNIRIPINQIRQ